MYEISTTIGRRYALILIFSTMDIASMRMLSAALYLYQYPFLSILEFDSISTKYDY